MRSSKILLLLVIVLLASLLVTSQKTKRVKEKKRSRSNTQLKANEKAKNTKPIIDTSTNELNDGGWGRKSMKQKKSGKQSLKNTPKEDHVVGSNKFQQPGKPDALKKKDTVVNAGQKPQTTRPSETVLLKEPYTKLMTGLVRKDVDEIQTLINKWDLTSATGQKRSQVRVTDNWRIDIQGDFKDSKGLLPKNGRWANIQIQKNIQRPGGKSTTAAQVNVQLGQEFTVQEFRDAFNESLSKENGGYKVWMYKKIGDVNGASQTGPSAKNKAKNTKPKW